mgnify:CR=1 FL=1
MLFDYNVVLDSLPLYFGGVLVTLKLLIIALAVGLLAALRTRGRSAAAGN